MDLFCQLQEQLLLNLRSRVRRGETTERQLARTTGVSQPHIHNILKGYRDLTPATADRILNALHLSIIDLIDTADLRYGLDSRPDILETPRELVMLSLPVGHGSRWPPSDSRFERLSVSENDVAGMVEPVSFRLVPDPVMITAFRGRCVGVADLGQPAKIDDSEALYLIARNGEAAIRWVRLGRRHAYLATSATLECPAQWEAMPLASYPLETLVISKVRFISWQPQLTARLRPPGTFRGPGLHSLAS